MTRRASYIAVLLLWFGCAAKASILTIQATGSVFSTDGLSGFSIGQQFQLTYNLDTEAVDFLPNDSRVGAYRTAVTNVRVTVDSYEATALYGGVQISNLTPPDPNSPYLPDLNPDAYLLASGQCRYAGYQYCDSLSGPAVDGRYLYYIEMDLYDPTQTAFSNDLLPAYAPSVGSFPLSPQLSTNGNRALILTFATSDLGGSGITGAASVRASVDSVQVVPLPPAAWLFGGALAGLGVLKRRKATA